MKVALYTRVSTEDQVKEGTSLTVQREALENFVARESGWEIYYPEPGKIYEDDGYSGYSMDRPALRRLLIDARQKKFDLILSYKIDRFSRNLRDLLNLVDELDTYKISLKSATEFYDTTNSVGRMMFQQLGSFAEFERNRIKEAYFPVWRREWNAATGKVHAMFHMDTAMTPTTRRKNCVLLKRGGNCADDLHYVSFRAEHVPDRRLPV